jgi:hypothetical protein
VTPRRYRLRHVIVLVLALLVALFAMHPVALPKSAGPLALALADHDALYVIDRFEDGGWAVLERQDGLGFNVPVEWLPQEAREGDILRLATTPEGKASYLRFKIDEAATEEQREHVEEIRSRLPRGPEGDIEL